MTDLPLSILSRGCGRLVAADGGSGGRDGRLDVCFTPQDYDLWKSKETLLRLSSRGRLFAESTIPKTFSTRRGPLLLYSQELVTVETNDRPDLDVRKKKVIRRDTQQLKQRLSSLKELTAAILSYKSNQSISSRLAYPLNLPPTLHRTRPVSPPATDAPDSPDLPVQLNPQWLPAKNSTAVKTQDEETNEEQDNECVRVDVFLQMPRTSRTPTPQQWLHCVATSPHKAEEQQSDTDDIVQDPERSLHVTDEETCHPSMEGVHDGDASIQDDRNPGDKDEKSLGKQEQQIHVKPETNTPLGLFLRQKVKHSVFNRLWEEKDELRCEASSSDGRHPHRLPPIAEGRALTPGQRSHATAQPDVQGDAARVRPQENMNRLNKEPLVLPLLFPVTDETKQRRGRDKTKKLHFKKNGVTGGGGGGGGGGRLPSDKGSVILLEPEEEPSPPVGVLGCVAGWKGPGRQSSFAFLQNRTPDLHEPSDSGLVRGVLPLELRDFQNGRSVGCLILGPDGEIVQLSLNDTGRGLLQDDGDLKQQALQVLSTEGEELPWVIVLQPEPVDTEGELELSTCEPQSDAPQSKHRDFVQGVFQETERHLALCDRYDRGVSLSEQQIENSSHKGNARGVQNSSVLNSNQFSGLPRSTETKARSPTGHADTVIVTKNKTKSAGEPLKTWKEAKNRVKMPPLKEQGGKEELRGGSTDEEEEDDEQLSITEQSDRLYESYQPRKKLQNTSLKETAARDVDKWRKKRATEEDAVTAGKSETSLEDRPELNEQEKRKMKEGKQQKPRSGDIPSVRTLRRDGSISREEAETQDQSAPSPKKKKIKNRGKIKMNEEREDQESLRRNMSAGRRRKRRGRPTHKETTAENLNPSENEDVGIHQEIKADPHRPTSATQTAEADSDSSSDSDDLGTSDKRSCIQSVSSLRSSLTSSQPRSSVRSLTSFYERTVPASAVGLASSHGRLSSCSTVMITEDQLMLNPVKPEFPQPTKGQEAEEAAAQRLAQRAEHRRQEVERKRRQQEVEERKQQDKEQAEERMKNELEGERRKRAEELRLKKLTEEEERSRQEEEVQERVRRDQAQRERERRRQEEMRRQIERLHRMREQEEQRRKAELERLRLEEEKKKQEEENQKLQQMDEGERMEYLRRKEQEEEERQKEEEERKRREEEAVCLAAEEARLQAELLAEQVALLQQQLVFKRDLMLEAEGLEKTQGISRPWIYSYFTLLQLLGPNSVRAITKTP